ncbi:hypothetical protein Q604_UNBC03516G0001, partial [human gut metagenome]
GGGGGGGVGYALVAGFRQGLDDVKADQGLVLGDKDTTFGAGLSSHAVIVVWSPSLSRDGVVSGSAGASVAQLVEASDSK